MDQETQEEKLLTIYVEAGKLRNAVSKVLGGLSRKAAPSILDHGVDLLLPLHGML